MSMLSIRHLNPTPHGISATLSGGQHLQIDLAEEWLLRVAIMPATGLAVGRSWMIAPEQNPPLNGRDRLSLAGFSCPPVATANTDSGFTLCAKSLRIRVEAEPLRLHFEYSADDRWQTLCSDRENGAYQWLPQRGSFRHFQHIERQERHFGLGDKSGPLDRTRRRFVCLQTDALGYDAEHSDPLYKHAPFFITQQTGRPAFGLLYDTFSEISFDFGCEHSNYYHPFRQVAAQEEGLVYYLIAGPAVRDIVPRLHRLTGMPAMPPRWSMGFAFSAMAHTDSPQAQDEILNFAHAMRTQRLPLSALHFGSGYSQKDNGRRYVFNWNLKKFPQRPALFQALKALGLHTCANVKPVLLDDHAAFKQAQQEGWLVTRADGTPAIERFWDGAGAQLDFSHPAALKFWREGLQSQVLGAGFDSVWNDNNEAELWDEQATLHGYGQRLNGLLMRPLHALQMLRTSYHTLRETAPTKRPYTISRAGPIGIARYGETWSGDNQTSWHSLKWNLRQGLSMSLSGFPVTGHDIGGFSGPSPTPELLVRWFQMMALHPRAVMNSWKPEEALQTNLPFMYAAVTPQVRAALELRYRFLPYLYALAYQTHQSGHPLIRPLFYDYDDAACFIDQDTFLLGTNVLVAPATAPDQQKHRVYLPAVSGGWVLWQTDEVWAGGQWVELEAALDFLPIFIRAGSLIPLAQHWDIAAPHDATALEVRAYPTADSGEETLTLLLDNGDSIALQEVVTLRMQWNSSRVRFERLGAVAWPSDLPLVFSCPTLGARRIENAVQAGELK